MAPPSDLVPFHYVPFHQVLFHPVPPTVRLPTTLSDPLQPAGTQAPPC